MAGVEFGFEIKGTEELVKKLRPETVKTPLAEGLKKITLFLHREVQTSTPVDTGRLRSSVTSQVAAEFGRVGTNVFYAPFVEYGTAKMEARHVMPGTSTRVYGKGPFTRGMEELQKRVGEFIKDIGQVIEARFG